MQGAEFVFVTLKVVDRRVVKGVYSCQGKQKEIAKRGLNAKLYRYI